MEWTSWRSITVSVADAGSSIADFDDKNSRSSDVRMAPAARVPRGGRCLLDCPCQRALPVRPPVCCDIIWDGDVRLLLTELRLLVELNSGAAAGNSPTSGTAEAHTQKLNKETGLSEAGKKVFYKIHLFVLFKPVATRRG